MKQSDRDLLAQWAGEELFAAGRAEAGSRPVNRARGEFYVDLMQWDPTPPSPKSCEQTLIGDLLSEAFRSRR